MRCQIGFHGGGFLCLVAFTHDPHLQIRGSVILEFDTPLSVLRRECVDPYFIPH